MQAMIRSVPPAAGAALDIDSEDAPQAPRLHALQGAAECDVWGALFGLARPLQGLGAGRDAVAPGTRTAASGGHAHPEGVKAR